MLIHAVPGWKRLRSRPSTKLKLRPVLEHPQRELVRRGMTEKTKRSSAGRSEATNPWAIPFIMDGRSFT